MPTQAAAPMHLNAAYLLLAVALCWLQLRKMLALLSCWIILSRFPKVRTLLAMVLHALTARMLIAIDGVMPLPCGILRSPEEFLRRSDLLVRALRPWRVGTGRTPKLRLERANAPSASLEPDKAPTRAAVRVSSPDGSDVCGFWACPGMTELFVKSGHARSRGLPLWLTALASFGGNREVLFYRSIRKLLPESVSAPVALIAEEAPLLARWIIVLTNLSPAGTVEYVRADESGGDARPTPGGGRRRRCRSPAPAARMGSSISSPSPAYVVPDRTGCSLAQALGVVRGLARLHAAFWCETRGLDELCRHRGSAAGYVPAPAVALLLGRTLPKLPRLHSLWKRLLARLADAPVTLVHGDCRPENLLFHAAAAAAERDESVRDAGGRGVGWRVSFLDWEAVGVNPPANDLAYFMVVGLRAAESAAWEETLLAAYHDELRAELRPGTEPYPLERLRDDYRLLGCAMLVVQACFAVSDIFRGWGNNSRNLLPWMARLCRFTLRLDVDRVCALLGERGEGRGRRRGAVAKGEAGGGEGEGVREVLEGMQQKAAAGLERLRAENGVPVVDGL